MSERRTHKETRLDLIGTSAIEPWFNFVSAPRKAMAATQIGQALVVNGAEPRNHFTGAEMEFGKYEFDIRLPVDATILEVIPKYPTGIGRDAIHHNPITTIVYEAYYDDKKTIGILDVPDHGQFHMTFGFNYRRNPEVWEHITPGARISKEDVIASSPAVTQQGQVALGVEAETIFLSDPGTIEDGFVMSESFLEKMVPTSIVTQVANWGRKFFPLNLYGDDEVYKPFPDIGEKIREDGLLFALREYHDDLAVVEMTPAALREVDYAFDRPVYGHPNATVADITVYHDDRLNPSYTPTGMDTQPRKYYDGYAQYYRRLLTIYNDIRRRRKKAGGELHITPEFNQRLYEAQIYLPVPENEGRKLNRMYRLEPLDEWRVEVTYRYNNNPTVGYKFTDMHGGKGVDCRTLPDHEMPTDANKNRTDVIIYGGSTFNRMNIGRNYEQFFNAVYRDLVQRLRVEGGMDRHLVPTSHQVATVTRDKTYTDWAWNLLLGLYKLVSPKQYEIMLNHGHPATHVREVLQNGIAMYLPPDNPIDDLSVVRELINSEYAPLYQPVTYYNSRGERCQTAGPALIGSMYILMLEKTGEDWSSAASVKVQHFGVPARLNNYDKQSTPGRQMPVRALGESETRSYAALGPGPMGTAELLDQSSNPQTHQEVVRSILRADRPTAITRAVDRNKVPYGGSRPVSLVRHIMECRGIKFVYQPEE